MKQEILLKRTDEEGRWRRPLAFVGEEVYTGDTKDRDATRWRKVRVFRTDGGYVIGIGVITYFDGERDNYVVTKAKMREGVMDIIRREVPELENDVIGDLRNSEENK